jgi:hypothetical protein
VWRPDVCRPLAALGPVPLSWSSGTLATERFYLPRLRKTNEGEPYLVISFTNAQSFSIRRVRWRRRSAHRREAREEAEAYCEKTRWSGVLRSVGHGGAFKGLARI